MKIRRTNSGGRIDTSSLDLYCHVPCHKCALVFLNPKCQNQVVRVPVMSQSGPPFPLLQCIHNTLLLDFCFIQCCCKFNYWHSKIWYFSVCHLNFFNILSLRFRKWNRNFKKTAFRYGIIQKVSATKVEQQVYCCLKYS